MYGESANRAAGRTRAADDERCTHRYLRRTSREPADLEALRLGLRELGYVEGQNLIIDERYANGVAARLPDLARELIELKIQVLVVDGGATVRAVREVVGTTPLVFTLLTDPVAMGIARSLDHPVTRPPWG